MTKPAPGGLLARGFLHCSHHTGGLLAMSKQAYKRVRRALSLPVCREPLPAFAWPGGYPLFYLTSDGATLCPNCVNREIVRVDSEQRDPQRHDQFRVVASDVHWEGEALTCEHCNAEILSAYGVPETA